MSLTTFRVKPAEEAQRKRPVEITPDTVKRIRATSTRGPATRSLLRCRADDTWPMISPETDILDTKGVAGESGDGAKYVRIPVRAPKFDGTPQQQRDGRHLVLDIGDDLILTKLIPGKDRMLKQNGRMDGVTSFTPYTAVIVMRQEGEPTDTEKARDEAFASLDKRLRQLVMHNKQMINDRMLHEASVADTYVQKLCSFHTKPDDPNSVPAMYVDVMPAGVPYATRIIELPEQGENGGTPVPRPITPEQLVARECVWTAKATVILDSVYINPLAAWAVKFTAVELVVTEKTSSARGQASRFFPDTVFVNDEAYTIRGDSVQSLYTQVPLAICASSPPHTPPSPPPVVVMCTSTENGVINENKVVGITDELANRDPPAHSSKRSKTRTIESDPSIQSIVF